MNKNFLGFLNVKQEEQTQVMLMLGMGFFMGIFVATYQVTAESLFLNKLSNQLNNAFLISGVLGILTTFVFSIIQNRVRFTRLAFVTILLIVVTVTLLHYFYHSPQAIVREKVLFLMYCLTGPITALLLLCYWGIFGRLFNFRQSKRIIGWIDTGQLIAIIMANFLIPLTSSLFPDTSDYLFACNVSILFSLVCLVLIARKNTLTKDNPVEFDKTIKTETRFSKMFKDKYILLLSIFLVVSMVTFVFNQYAFQTVINKQYPSQQELTNFLAYFNGTVYALSLVMQTFVNDRILSGYGIRVSLFLLPVITGLLTIGAIAAGIIFGISPESGQDSFIFFFLLVSLTRMFNGTLKESLENPVFKLLFIPLDARYRFGIQAKVEGVVSESGRFFAGVFIFCFSLMAIFQVIWIPILVVVLCGIYMVVIRNLYSGYKNKIRSKLESTEYSQDKLEVGYANITSQLEQRLNDKEESRAVFSFKLLEKINPSKIGLWVNAMMRSQSENTRDYAQRRMNELKGLSVSESYVIKAGADTAGKKLLTKGDLEQIINSGGDITRTRILKLARSGEANDRQYAAELLLHSSAEENISFLIELLNDTEIKVRRTAITTAIKKNNSEVIYSLIENLSNPTFSNQAMNSLVLIGGKALGYLDSSFYRTGQLTQTMIRIVQIIGRIGGQKARDLLWNKIDYPDKVIVSQVLLSLGECGFKAGIAQITRIKYAIESDIADITWNLSALQEIGNNDEAQVVKAAMRREIQNDTEHIYMLLAMLYDTRSIQLVKENIESGTSEGTTYAVELLDVFLSEQLKVRVIPVIDDLSDQEKINRLEVFYPRVKLDEKLVLKFLINRDFTQTNRWTKSCVIHLIGQLKIRDFTLDLIAQLFNPDRLVCQIAAWSLFQIDETIYHQNTLRLGIENKRNLDRTICPSKESGLAPQLMLFEKVVFFQTISIFENMPGISLSYLADISTEVILHEKEFLSIDEKMNNDFFVVYDGIASYFEKGEMVAEYKQGNFIGEKLSPAGFANSNHLVARTDTRILKINKDQFYELMADNVKLASRVLEYI